MPQCLSQSPRPHEHLPLRDNYYCRILVFKSSWLILFTKNMFVQNTIKLLWQIRKQCYEVSFAIMNIYLHKNINIKSSLSGISGPSQRSEIWSPMRATTSLASLAAYSCWAVFAMFQNLILMAYLDVPILMATLYVLNPKGFF